MLSGFVLGKQLDICYERADFKALKVFYLRRWMRTLPIFVVMLVCLSAFTQSLFSMRFFEYLTFTTTWLSTPSTNDYFVTAWSLAIEEWFYLLFPPVLILISRRGLNRGYAVAIFIGIFFGAKLFHVLTEVDYVESLRRTTLFRLDSIAIGHTVYQACNAYGSFMARHVKKAWGLGLIFTGITYALFINDFIFLYIYSSAIAACCLIVAFRFSEDWFAKIRFVNLLSSFAAHTSYCAYLVHLVIFQALSGLVFHQNVILGIYIFSVVAFSVFSFYAIELPFQNARPTYNSTPRKEEDTFRNSLLLKLVTNALVFALVIVLIEFSSRKTLELYYALKNNPQMKTKISLLDEKDVPNEEAKLIAAFKRDNAKRDSMEGSPYVYSSFDVFKHRAFSSETINIDEKGERIVPTNPSDASDFNIWVMGASPIFGATNADAWTIPARMQIHFSKHMPKRNVMVRNRVVLLKDST